jgi:hypothetical protein
LSNQKLDDSSQALNNSDFTLEKNKGRTKNRVFKLLTAEKNRGMPDNKKIN